MMNTRTSTNYVAGVSMLVLFAVLSTQSHHSAYAADPRVAGALGSVPIAELGAMASGAAEDTLKACMARIPKVASAGQRMLAEQSCRGEEETRQTIQSAPTF